MGVLLSKAFQKQVLVKSLGPKVIKGDVVTVHCTGSLNDSTQFWSTKDPGQTPLTFPCGLGKVIKGWDEAVLSMCKGERSCFTIPPDMAYGSKGFPAWNIPPNATLIFDIELLEIEGK